MLRVHPPTAGCHSEAQNCQALEEQQAGRKHLQMPGLGVCHAGMQELEKWNAAQNLMGKLEMLQMLRQNVCHTEINGDVALKEQKAEPTHMVQMQMRVGHAGMQGAPALYALKAE